MASYHMPGSPSGGAVGYEELDQVGADSLEGSPQGRHPQIKMVNWLPMLGRQRETKETVYSHALGR